MENHIYALNSDVFSDEKLFGFYYDAMPQNRKEKIDRLRFDKDKRLSLGASVLIQKALHLFELSYADIEYNKYGKPLITCKENAFFNISHSGNMVVCAVSEHKVGVDIEKIQCFEENVLNCVFLENEISKIRIHSLNPNYDYKKLWTIKESLVKCKGLGFSLEPLKLYIKNEVQNEVYCDGKKLSNIYFRTYDLERYVITICSEDEPFSESIERFVLE